MLLKLADISAAGHAQAFPKLTVKRCCFPPTQSEAAYPANKEEAKRLRIRLLDAVARSRPVRELAGNPLLLTILAIISRRQRLPRDRAGVYQHAVNVLIAHWDEDTKHLDHTAGIRAIADLDDRDRREMLERLARHMQSGEGGIAGNHVLAEDVEKVFTDYLRETLQLRPAPATTVARAMVNQFRERNFILSRYGSEVYGFVHRAFLEYLAASDIVRRYEQRELNDDLLNGIFRLRAPDPDWHEVLLLIVAQTGEHFAAQAVDTILSLEDSEQVTAAGPPAVLAMRALSEVRRIGRLTDQSTRTAKALIRYLEANRYLPGDISQDLETSLSLLGHGWSGARHLLRWLQVSDSGGAYVCYQLFADKAALKVVALAAPTGLHRAVALGHLAERWRDDPAVRTFVKDRAINDPSADVRTDTMEEIVLAWSDDPTLQDFLLERAVHDPHQSVRHMAVMSLADSQADGPKARTFLEALLTDEAGEDDTRVVAARSLTQLGRTAAADGLQGLFTDLAAHDPSSRVRSEAQIALAALFGESPAVRDFLMDRIAADPNKQARRTALHALATECPEAPGVREAVLAYASDSNTDGPLREQAIQAFTASYWNEGQESQALLRDWGTNNPEPHVRAAVLIGLSDFRPDDPDARAFLIDTLPSEPDARLRRFMLDRIAYISEDDPTVLQAFQNSAITDPDEQCRLAALLSLSQGWPRSEDVRSFISARAAEDPHSDVRAAAQEYLDQFWPSASAPGPLAAALRQRALEDTSDECFEYLQTQLHQSPHSQVRVAASQVLGSCWSADARTVPALTTQASREGDSGTRSLIQQAVATATAYAPVHELLF
ncbi:HEAT repeat domain-containing protein [Streptomyces europaeiscabiei]|uniref:HEAT repeat domain-containing protein n=1 Tax=Streptomyces europaeiscabiei TaxID=146819 RepID=UPI0029A2AFB1|nr:HEAT repeat domain-containing protein [Streptomyces europaeiscabiei]MDX3589068.1 HEAT repeat domain-containing protein [Streptomyces europaeiscabiei]